MEIVEPSPKKAMGQQVFDLKNVATCLHKEVAILEVFFT